MMASNLLYVKRHDLLKLHNSFQSLFQVALLNYPRIKKVLKGPILKQYQTSATVIYITNFVNLGS